MQAKLLVAIAACALTGLAQAQTTTNRTAEEAARDAAAAGKAAVTPGDQNSGRTPDNRTGGVMGTDRPTGAAITPGDQNMGRTPNNRTGGVMGTDRPAGAAVTPGDQNMGRDPNNRSGGLMGNDRTGAGTDASAGMRAPRADRN